MTLFFLGGFTIIAWAISTDIHTHTHIGTQEKKLFLLTENLEFKLVSLRLYSSYVVQPTNSTQLIWTGLN